MLVPARYEVFCCPELRGSGCPYLEGRYVLHVCYDRLRASILSILRRLSTSLRVRYRSFHCKMEILCLYYASNTSIQQAKSVDFNGVEFILIEVLLLKYFDSTHADAHTRLLHSIDLYLCLKYIIYT